MTKLGVVWRVLLALLVLGALIWIGVANPLLFHTVVEILILVICFSIFVVAWYSRGFSGSGFFTFLGIAYLFIGIMELFGALGMKGLPFFAGYSPDLDAQLWIITRYIQAISFFIAFFHINRLVHIRTTIALYMTTVVLALLAIFTWRIFPLCYIEGQGWTLFYDTSNYIVAATFSISCIMLWQARHRFERIVIIYLLASALLAVVGLFSHDLNHLLYLASFFLIYRTIVVNGLLKPYQVLYRDLASERDHLQQLLDIEESLLIALDSEGRVTLVNRKAASVLGYSIREMLGKPWFHTYLPEHLRATAATGFSQLIAGQTELVKFHRRPILTASREERMIAWNNAPIYDEAGKITGTFSSGQDITEQRQAEALFRITFNRSPVGLYIAENGRFVMVNPQLCKWAGYREQELIGRETLSLVCPEDREHVHREAIRSLKSEQGDQFSSYDYRIKTSDGKVRWFMETVTSIRFSGRCATLGSLIDVTERKENEELFRSLSLTDDLTGLYNRRGFLMLATKEVQLGHRLDKGVSILFADVDKLKYINDTFGHLEGDAALISVAAIFKETFRESDITGRLMGDEFAVFMLGTDEEYASKIIARLEKKLDSFNSTSAKPYRLSLSFGLATCPTGERCDLADLMNKADSVMYRQKRNGA